MTIKTQYKRFKFNVSGYVFAQDGMDAQGFIENAIWDGYNSRETQIMIDNTDIKELSADEDKRLTEQERQKYAAMDQRQDYNKQEAGENITRCGS